MLPRPRSDVIEPLGSEYPPLYPEVSESELPRISDSLLGCVFYIYPTVSAARRGEFVGGTGFLVAARLSNNSDYGQIYGVTNKHIVEELGSKIPNTMLSAFFCQVDNPGLSARLSTR
jgi:hypothetical protein